MKLKSKLFVSFCIMLVLPVALCCMVIGFIYNLHIDSICKIYGVDGEDLIKNIYSPMSVMGQMTEDIYNEMKEVSETDPERFDDETYLEELDVRLEQKLSTITVFKNGYLKYTSSGMEKSELQELLPNAVSGVNVSDTGTYKGGQYQKLIKQLYFRDSDGNEYTVSIVTSLNQVIPQLKVLGVQAVIAIVLVLLLTSMLLIIWIYSSIIKPVGRLRLATNNIKNGNFDFEMPKTSNDEIGDVCKDFEEMRVILKQSAEDKINSDKEEKELIRNISHDLKTPLTAIKGYVEGILDGIADTPEKQEKYLRTIANKVNDMDKLIDELTIYSRLDTNRMPYTFSKISIKQYFDDYCDELSMDLESQNIELEYMNYVENNVMVAVDTEQFKRVVNNIISNSVKYMSGVRKGHIGIKVYDEGTYVHIIMQDNGKGIGSKELPHIFERFYRTDDSRNSSQGGSGIGLAIVKRIIEDHKGKIWADSVEGEGTAMHILLKVCKEDRTALPMK